MTKRRRSKEDSERTAPVPLKTIQNQGGRFLAICAALAILTLAVFWGVRSSSFVSMDDGAYVTENTRVQGGLTMENIKWAFSTTYFGFYCPFTWLSHMLDCQFYGLSAGGHHMTSLMIHILSALILFAALFRMTGALWRSAAASALFAVHPLHVESVAWISERKDVLCAFFWFLCILSYSYYVQRPSVKRYIPVLLAFLFGLMAKPMIVTLPFTLLLLDYWPLNRLPLTKAETGDVNGRKYGTWSRLLLEKLPLFCLVPVFSFIAFSAQKHVGAANSLATTPLAQRAGNALISYAGYIKEMIFPSGLACYYPLSGVHISPEKVFFCGILLAAITVASLLFGQKRRYLATGWLWYLGTLVPVIGLVQIGGQAMADRYTYVPLVGLFIMTVWGAGEIASLGPYAKKIAAAASVLVILSLASITRVQAGYWKDGYSISERALAVTADNWFMHFHMGEALNERGKKEEAISHFKESVRINPAFSDANLNLGNLLAEKGENGQAVECYEKALKNAEHPARILNNMGIALRKMKRLPEAVERLKEAERIDPGYANTHVSLGNALSESGRFDEAVVQYEMYLAADPGSAATLNNLGLALASSGRMAEAADRFSEAVRADPRLLDGYVNLGVALGRLKRYAEAEDAFKKALEIDPNSKTARAYLEQIERTNGDRRTDGSASPVL